RATRSTRRSCKSFEFQVGRRRVSSFEFRVGKEKSFEFRVSSLQLGRKGFRASRVSSWERNELRASFRESRESRVARALLPPPLCGGGLGRGGFACNPS